MFVHDIYLVDGCGCRELVACGQPRMSKGLVANRLYKERGGERLKYLWLRLYGQNAPDPNLSIEFRNVRYEC